LLLLGLPNALYIIAWLLMIGKDFVPSKTNLELESNCIHIYTLINKAQISQRSY
jgi:hypothetical protein